MNSEHCHRSDASERFLAEQVSEKYVNGLRRIVGIFLYNWPDGWAFPDFFGQQSANGQGFRCAYIIMIGLSMYRRQGMTWVILLFLLFLIPCTINLLPTKKYAALQDDLITHYSHYASIIL